MLISGQINRVLYRDRQEAECAERLARIKRAWDYYEGRHPKPLFVRPGQQDDNVIVNLARPIVDKGIALLFGKESSGRSMRPAQRIPASKST